MKDFNFTIPQKVIFGMNKIKTLGSVIQELKMNKVLLISDRMLEEIGYVDRIRKILEEAKVEVYFFLDVEANPSIETVNAATEHYLNGDCQGIVALGGGSPMDVAKAVGVVARYGGEISSYEGAHKVPGAIVPLIAIPTTAGTGSEVTAFSVITDQERNYKLTVFSYELIPSYAILDPSLIMSLPPSVAAATGMDALVHAIEAYLSKASSLFTDAMAEKAMELIATYIRRFVANREDEEAACAMLCASNFAGIAFGFARLGNVHAMAHPLGGFFNVPHGVANAILLPIVLEYNALADQGRYQKIYQLLSGKEMSRSKFNTKILVHEIRNLLVELNLPRSLKELGVSEKLIPQMAADAMKSGNISVNPRSTTIKEIEGLYKLAIRGSL